MKNFRLTDLTFRMTFEHLDFFVLRGLNFSLISNFEQLNSSGGSSLLKLNGTCAEIGINFYTLNFISGYNGNSL